MGRKHSSLRRIVPVVSQHISILKISKYIIPTPNRLIKAVLKKSFGKRGKSDISNFSKVRNKKARLAHLPLSNMIHEFSSALQLHRNVNLIPGSSDCFYRGSLDTQGQPTPWSHLHGGQGEGTPWNSRMGKGRKPCCPVALL